MLQKQDILSYLLKNKDYLNKQFSVEKIGLFGSYARDEQTEQSDIDIIIEMPKGTENIFEKKQKLRELLIIEFNHNIDICRERAIKPLFKEMILKDTIYV